jgi:glycosyltransferase involved in cell wall biosynthesis
VNFPPSDIADSLALNAIPSNSEESKSDLPLPKVAILLCTFHGQHYLTHQLESFSDQTNKNWELWVSDDGSVDDTHFILESYQNKWGIERLSIHSGPAEGFVANFLSLTCKANVNADYYAYSDQDDIWEPEKLERALEWLNTIPRDTPALYCSRTRLVDSNNIDIGLSPLFSKPPSFANALAQNIGGGNTMVFNNAARELLKYAGDNVDVVTHDWWVYLVVTGCGGKVYYDPRPSLRYRQHDNNQIGIENDWRARINRIKLLWQGRFKSLNEQHIQALERLRPCLTDANKYTLDTFAAAREETFFQRMLGFWRSGIYRQTLLGNMGLVLAVMFKRL